MSLYGSIRLAANTLQANQIGLQVVGQNIANVNTPGYIREEVILTPAPTQRKGDLLLGLGVDVLAVVQKIDHFLEERLRGSVSDRVDAETREANYMQLEQLIGELSDTDLSTALNNFFSSIAEILNDHTSISTRNLAVLQGSTLTTDINRLAQRVTQIRSDVNDRIIDMGGNINRLVEEIRVLNIRIANVEGGDTSQSDAVGLRDQRLQALENLSKLIDIRVREQSSGGVVVYSGGDFLVFDGVAREVEVALESDRGLSIADIRIKESDSPVNSSSGELAGLLVSRDQIMAGFLDDLDEFAGTMAFEFNKIYSRGQGLTGYQDLTSEFTVTDNLAALNAAGLDFTPENGSFEILVHNTNTEDTQTTDIRVDLNGLGDDMTLTDLAAALNAVDGVTVTTTSSGRLTMTSNSPDQEFFFRNDTSGILAALGLNTFFSGSTASDLSVNSVVADDPATFAASLYNGSGNFVPNTQNAVILARFLDEPIQSQNDATLAVLYDRLTGETTQAAAISRSVAEGARVFEQTLRGQKMATSGVSLDEEVVRMMAFQRSFQASARYISTLDELLGILVAL